MDYSLLLGIHDCARAEQENQERQERESEDNEDNDDDSDSGSGLENRNVGERYVIKV